MSQPQQFSFSPLFFLFHRRRQLSPGVFSLTPEGYVPVMKKLDVSCIVRFNSKCYDRNVFLMNGIRCVFLRVCLSFLQLLALLLLVVVVVFMDSSKDLSSSFVFAHLSPVVFISFTFLSHRHVDLYYEDGGNPSEEILQAFLQLCETERAAIAVHCKAGLGRTGTNIAAYMMKHYGYTARECMAWCR